MSIIERTQYSADGGKAWKETRELAVADGVRSSLAVAVSRYDKPSCWNVASDVMRLCTHNPDALITALRDMGALPEESGESNDWANGSWARAADAVERGELQHGGQRYAVVPMEEYQRAAAALEAIKAVARGDGPIFSASNWCDANHINWRDD